MSESAKSGDPSAERPPASGPTDSAPGGVRVQAKQTSPVVHTLEVDVDVSRVRRAFDQVYRELAKRARIPGFRPGKAPRAVLKRMYGASLDESVERNLVAETLPEAIEQSGLSPVSEPTVDASPPRPDASFRYTARIEIKPEFVLAETRGLPGQRPAVQIGEEEVQTQLEALREQRGQLVEEPEGTPAGADHVVIVDYEGRIDDKPFEGGSGRGVSVQMGSERFLPGFTDQLAGVVAGEDREVRVRFPDDYASAELAGKEVGFAVHVAELKRRDVPELDDEFAKDVGDFETLGDLRARIRTDMTAAAERESLAALQHSVVDALIDRTAFDVPPGWVDRQLQRRLAAARERLRGSLPEDALESQLARWREEWRDAAEREVREMLLLEAVASQQEFQVADEEVMARIEEMARQRDVSPERLEKVYRKEGLFEALRDQLRDAQALDFLVREANVEEKTGT